MKSDMLHKTYDMCPMTGGGGEPSLKMSAPYFLQFGTEGVLKIFTQRMNESLN